MTTYFCCICVLSCIHVMMSILSLIVVPDTSILMYLFKKTHIIQLSLQPHQLFYNWKRFMFESKPIPVTVGYIAEIKPAGKYALY